MNKRFWIIGVCAVLLLIAGIIIYNRGHITVDRNEDGTSVSIIGGADGPTSVFIAGKLGGDDVAEEVKKLLLNWLLWDIQILLSAAVFLTGQEKWRSSLKIRTPLKHWKQKVMELLSRPLGGRRGVPWLRVPVALYRSDVYGGSAGKPPAAFCIPRGKASLDVFQSASLLR